MRWISPEAQPRVRRDQRTSEGDFNKQRQCNKGGCKGMTFQIFMGKRPRRSERAGVLVECTKCGNTQWILSDGTVCGTLKE